MFRALVLIFCFCSTSVVLAEAASQGGLQLSVAGDIVGQFDAAKNGGATNRIEARELELMLYAPVDHLFDAVASLAAHQEKGSAFFEIHEAYIGSTKLIPRSRFRVGQFFLGFGRLQQFHRHDWPFISAPTYQNAFFRTGEAVLDTGAEFGYLLPTSLYLDFTAGITNGWVFGHAHNIGAKPYVPTHYARLATYADLPWNGGTQIGLNYVGRKDDAATMTSLFGLDLTAKWREAQRLLFLLQSETWVQIKSPRNADSERSIGFYIYPQYGFTQSLYLGVRVDGLTITTLQDAFGTSVGNFQYALVPTLSYKPSEFTTLRAGYTYESGSVNGVNTLFNRMIELQAVFILGAHPAHDF